MFQNNTSFPNGVLPLFCHQISSKNKVAPACTFGAGVKLKQLTWILN